MDSCANGNTFHKNATIYELANGDLLAGWFAGGVGEGNRDQNVYGSRLPADSTEWEDAECWADVEGRAVGCPVLFHGPDDKLWVTAPVMYGNWLTSSKVFFKRSPDEGETWKDLELLHEKTGMYLKNKPLVLEDENRWILPAYDAIDEKPYFYLIPGDYAERPADFPQLVGGDQITHYEAGGYMGNSGLTHPTVVELSDGSLLAYLRPRQGGYIHETRSTDRGLNWTRATQTAIPNPNAAFDMVRTDEGNLVLVNNPSTGVDHGTIPEGRNKLALFMSEDEGETWPYQLFLEQAALEDEHDPEGVSSDLRASHRLQLGEMDQVGRPEFTYGNVIQARDGTLHLAYEYRRSAIKHVEITESEIQKRGTDTVIVENMLS
ncbi:MULTISPECIES: exo-alpha-sialidase [unclassified Haladaptatus]|uniref:exo-alpha-sialidase n=3 Tax=Haladaptatus TaxID=367188 RepID=UPI0023E8DB01|nr:MULTISPECIES: exo-alpha-sialidase [unclassified Haladaptatus]